MLQKLIFVVFINFFISSTLSKNNLRIVVSNAGADWRVICDSKTLSTCGEAMGPQAESGVYLLQSNSSNQSKFYVYCLKDEKNGEPWMIIQRRVDGKIHFDRKWDSYKHGFGDLNGDHWLGLDLIHEMTYSKRHEIWFHMQDFDCNYRDAFYNTFVVGDENSQYELKALGKYSGDAGDSFSYHAGFKFSTKDRDNDVKLEGSCVNSLGTGAWWHGNCRESDLNGIYFDQKTNKDSGIQWYAWHGKWYSLKSVHMAIRPVVEIN